MPVIELPRPLFVAAVRAAIGAFPTNAIYDEPGLGVAPWEAWVSLAAKLL